MVLSAKAIKSAGLGSLQQKEIADAYRLNMKDKARALKEIRRGNLVIIPTGWKGHAITLLFYKGYLLICNRGEGTEKQANAEFYRIDPKAVDLALLNEFDKTISNKELTTALPFFYDKLPRQLSPKQDNEIHRDETCLQLSKAFAAGDQTVGNCPSAAPAGALRSAIGLVMTVGKGRPIDTTTVTKVKKINRKVLLMQRLRYLETYLGYHPEGDKTVDAYLVKEAWKKIKRQLKRNPISLDTFPLVKARLFDPTERPFYKRAFSSVGSGLSKLGKGASSLADRISGAIWPSRPVTN